MTRLLLLLLLLLCAAPSWAAGQPTPTLTPTEAVPAAPLEAELAGARAQLRAESEQLQRREGEWWNLVERRKRDARLRRLRKLQERIEALEREIEALKAREESLKKQAK